MPEQRVERKLVAILAADVAGYSRLIGLDEEGTLARLKTLRREVIDPEIASHRGRIVKTTGDGLLIEFASVVDAVRCAVAMQRACVESETALPQDRRIEFRIGVNLGDVVVEGDDILGDGVNVAARLEGIANAGGICISEDVFRQVQGRVEVEFNDLGDQQLKNIARPIRAYSLVLHKAGSIHSAPLPLPDKPSIAVLPFQNMSGDPEQEYFVDGIVEEITTAMARLPWLFVIARNSAFTYKGKSVDVKRVASDLGVRYLVEGSVRRAGARVRITGQLIDAATGAHIWADRFDGGLDDIFELQDDVASSIAGAIEPKLRLAEMERARRKPTENLDAYDLYLRALSEFYKVTFKANQEALRLSNQALALDASYAPAAAIAAASWAARKYHAWAPISDENVAQALDLAKTAIELGKDDPDSLSRAGWALSFFTGDLATGSRAVERAMALNPNSAAAWSGRGWLLVWMEEPEQAMECFARAMRLSPLDPWLFSHQYGTARCHFVMGRLDEALHWADKSLLEQPRAVNVTAFKLAVCGHLGMTHEARNCLDHLRDLRPGFSVATCTGQIIPRGVSARIVELWTEGLRKAGVPER